MCKKKINNIINCLVFIPQLKKENISDVMEMFRVPAQSFCNTNSTAPPCISFWVRAGITNFFEKDQVVNILGFADHADCVATT